MLPVAHRLRRREDFGLAVRHGRRAGTARLVVHLRSGSAPMTVTTPARAGFVVGRAVGGAVVRNRVRRRLRALVAARLSTLPPGSLLVVRALPAAAVASYDELAHDLDRTAARVTRVSS